MRGFLLAASARSVYRVTAYIGLLHISKASVKPVLGCRGALCVGTLFSI